MDKINQNQIPLLLDQLFESTKKLIIDNLELSANASNESMRSYYEGMALGAYCLFSLHSPIKSPDYQELTNLIGFATDLEVNA
jgi:hypothetical protein